MPQMLNSSPDMMGIVAEINVRRFERVWNKHIRRTGVYSVPPNRLEQLKTVRKLHHRYLRGDYRHSDHEVGSLKQFCEWLVEVNADNQGVPPPSFEFNFNEMASAVHAKNGMYRELVQRAIQGWQTSG